MFPVSYLKSNGISKTITIGKKSLECKRFEKAAQDFVGK